MASEKPALHHRTLHGRLVLNSQSASGCFSSDFERSSLFRLVVGCNTRNRSSAS